MTFCHNFLMMEPIAVRLKRAGRAGRSSGGARALDKRCLFPLLTRCSGEMCFYRCFANERAKTWRAADRHRLCCAIEQSERRRRRRRRWESDATLAILQKERRWVSKAACRIFHTFIEAFDWRARIRRNANKGRDCQNCSQNAAAGQLKGRRRVFGTFRLLCRSG